VRRKFFGFEKKAKIEERFCKKNKPRPLSFRQLSI